MYFPGNLDWDSLIKHDPVLARPLISASFVGVVLVGLLAPLDTLSRWPSLAWLVSTVERFVPSISQWAAVSEFPEVTRVFFAVAWVLAPIQAALAYSLPAVHRQMVNHWRSRPAIRMVLPLLVLLILPTLIWAAAFIGWEPRNCIGICLGKSRVALVLLGTFIPMASGFAAVVIAIWVRRFKEIYFS